MSDEKDEKDSDCIDHQVITVDTKTGDVIEHPQKPDH